MEVDHSALETRGACLNISKHILARLKEQGVEHVFGIPGDFILPFFQEMLGNEVGHVATCNELNAGYAADGYARLRGLGAVAVTYGPGSFSLVNACASAYAESVPLLVISGGPSRKAYRERPALHHMLQDKYEVSMNIFTQITAYAALLDDPEQAPAQIDEALNICLSRNRPVYLEIPSDVQTCACPDPAPLQRVPTPQDASALAGALDDIATRVREGERTVVVPGHEVQREGLQDKVLQLLDKTGFSISSMFVGKADFAEQHPQCLGAYLGVGSLAEVAEYLEAADTLLFLGAVQSDFNLGGFTAKLRPEQVVSALDQRVITSTGDYSDVPLSALVDGLLESLPEGEADSAAPRHGFSHLAAASYKPQPDAPMTNSRFYDRIASFLRDGDIVAADAGCAINAAHVQFPAKATSVTSNYWAAIGMGFGAAFGACLAARPGQRVIALEGDGSFQMTAQELSSMARYDCPAIVFLVNNRGYTAERLIHDGPFNDIAEWRYHLLPAAWGGKGMEVRTEGDLEAALAEAESHRGPGPLLIEVHLEPFDVSEAFEKMSATLRTSKSK